jgi:ligand-binding SRPBCC domain-containing protein
MVEGAFKSFRHEHHFENINGATIMIDHFIYISPFGILGRIADFLFLKKYMTNLLEKRNSTIKEFAESDKWKKINQE